MTNSIFIFRRDYRLHDNLGLIECCKNSNKVYIVFIFTPEQIDNKMNSYKSHNSVKFLCDSLKELNEMTKNKLHIFNGTNTEVLSKLISKWNINSIYTNNDYTLYAKKRDAEIEKLTLSKNVDYFAIEDYNLLPINTIVPAGKKYYTKFRPFYDKLLQETIPRPIRFTNANKIVSNTHKDTLKIESISRFYDTNKVGKHVSKGGRKSGKKIIDTIENFNNYPEQRNNLIYDTTHLSAHIKYGTISIREVFYAIKDKLGLNSELLRQVIWHDFFNNMVYNNSDTFKEGMYPISKKIKWINNNTYTEKWKQARSGYPIIDACMTELNTTGYLHNRGRMIVANFLTRILGTHWKQGEKYFAQILYDYDPIQNNMGWTGQATVNGAQARPLIQTVLNPWIQSSKYDKDAQYIKKWLPILIDIPSRELHAWDKHHTKYKNIDYPKPIVDYKINREKMLQAYYDASK